MTLNVTCDDLFQPGPIQVWSIPGHRIEKDLLQVLGQFIPVPDAEVIKLMPTEKQALEVQRGENVVQPCQPVGHAMIICVLRFESERMVQVASLLRNGGGSPDNAEISRHPAKRRIAIGDEAKWGFDAGG